MRRNGEMREGQPVLPRCYLWTAIPRLDCQVKGGKLLREMKERGQRHSGYAGKKLELHDATPKLADLGLEKTQSHRWQRVESLPEKVRDKAGIGNQRPTLGL